jgi:hypothetical protein
MSFSVALFGALSFISRRVGLRDQVVCVFSIDPSASLPSAIDSGADYRAIDARALARPGDPTPGRAGNRCD